MNVLMPSPAAPTLDVATALLPVAPAAPAALPGLRTTPPFDLALQQLLGGPALADLPADETDDAPTLPDLLVSGLLQQAPGMPLPADAQAVPAPAPAPAPVAVAVAVAATAAAAPPIQLPLSASPVLPQPAPVPVRAPAAALSATALPLPTPAEASTQPVTPRAIHALQAMDLRTAAPQEQRAALTADFALPPTADATPPTAHAAGSALLAPELGSRAATATSQATSTAAPQPLLDALGERIALQMQRGSERVVIRLDPPMQGQIEISIRTDASGATQVHLSGSSGELTRQLHAISDSLRQELVQRQPGEVSVQVGQGMREQDERQRQERQFAGQDEPGRALDEERDEDSARHFALAADQDSR